MIQKSTLGFLKKLSANNNKEWMDVHKKEYQEARDNFLELVEQVIAGLDAIGVDTSALQAKNCVFRINRDIRFSANKDPYKTNFGAAFAEGGKKMGKAGYYVHLEPGASFIGGGMWMPDTLSLKKIRQEIDYNFKDFKRIVEGKKFMDTYGNIDGERLSRPPRGYEEDNPAVDYLKLKSFTAGIRIQDKEWSDPKVIERVLADFKALKPFIDFLNQALDE